jgi:hypothetical protein
MYGLGHLSRKSIVYGLGGEDVVEGKRLPHLAPQWIAELIPIEHARCAAHWRKLCAIVDRTRAAGYVSASLIRRVSAHHSDFVGISGLHKDRLFHMEKDLMPPALKAAVRIDAEHAYNLSWDFILDDDGVGKFQIWKAWYCF